jgi:hypothetical protein
MHHHDQRGTPLAQRELDPSCYARLWLQRASGRTRCYEGGGGGGLRAAGPGGWSSGAHRLAYKISRPIESQPELSTRVTSLRSCGV